MNEKTREQVQFHIWNYGNRPDGHGNRIWIIEVKNIVIELFYSFFFSPLVFCGFVFYVFGAIVLQEIDGRFKRY